ncbi:MAG: AAA family ATPase, partial [Solirubrobacterales bacterium]
MGVCPSCGTENPEGAKFCMACGTAFGRRCSTCETENPPAARFCISCGAELAAATPGTAAAPPPARSVEEAPPEERRKATVIFADLSGYTAVSERIDPERMKTLVDRALRRLGEEVERYGGTVDKYIGDNVMGVFGAPVAHEDDPERAVRAGLAMQAAMAEINERITADLGASFSLRVGINSGEVLAGRVGDGYTVIGDPVNVAARLQGAAKQGTVTVGEVTHRLTRGAIEYVELEPLELKGKSQPVPAWEAVRAVIGGRAARMTRPSTPLIGREDEAELLHSMYERVTHESRPHLVTVIGQAGVGKTRLLRELGREVSERDPNVMIRLGSCPAYGAGLAYWALGEVVRGQFEIADSDDAGAAWGKLSRGIAALVADADTEEPPERLAAIVGRPLGIEPPDGDGDGALPADTEDPQQMRDRLFSTVRSLVEAASRQHPLVLAIEDIHWADEGMLDLIEYLARWVRGPALLVCMARDELLDRRPGWGGGRLNATTITLEPLAQEHTLELVTALLPASGGGSGGEQLATQVAQRSGGNPLFAEEMVNRILEEGGDPEALPETVHSVLAARLDSLPRPERRILQHASVVGQTFWEGSLASVATEEGIGLSGALSGLQDKDLVVPTAGSRLAGEREYAFKHVLIRDVAYSTLPKAVRARKHAAVGTFIEERAADRSEGVVAMVADHLGRAAALADGADLEPAELERIDSRALDALEQAGDASAALYSNQEAFSHYEQALSLRRLLDPQTRARIAEKLGDVALRLGRVDRAVEAWEECMKHHRREEDLARVGDLHRKIGAGLWHKGDREGSIEHYQRGIDLLKDGPPSLELVRLYEEAASLYMHTGDNMLAIYA